MSADDHLSKFNILSVFDLLNAASFEQFYYLGNAMTEAVKEGERYSMGGGDINITLIHNGPLMGNAAEKQRFVADIGQALRREWRREYA